MSEELHVKLSPRLSELRAISTMVEEFGDAHQLPLPKVFVINLTLDELIANVATHGSFGDVPNPEIEVHLKVDHDVLILTMEDNGDMFDPDDRHETGHHVVTAVPRSGGLGPASGQELRRPCFLRIRRRQEPSDVGARSQADIEITGTASSPKKSFIDEHRNRGRT